MRPAFISNKTASIVVSNKLCDIHHAKQWKSINKVCRMPFSVTLRIDSNQTMGRWNNFCLFKSVPFQFYWQFEKRSFLFCDEIAVILYINFLLNVHFGLGFFFVLFCFEFCFDGISHRSHQNMMWNNLWNEQIWIGIIQLFVCVWWRKVKRTPKHNHNRNHK